METTIDRTGRLVVPKEMRDRLGIAAGTRVNIEEDGAVLRIELIATDPIIEVDGYLLIDGELDMTDDDLRDFRLADQR